MLVFLYLLLFGPALISAQTFDEYGFDEYGLDALGYDQNGKCASEFYPQVKANVNYTGSYCTDYKFIDSTCQILNRELATTQQTIRNSQRCGNN